MPRLVEDVQSLTKSISPPVEEAKTVKLFKKGVVKAGAHSPQQLTQDVISHLDAGMQVVAGASAEWAIWFDKRPKSRMYRVKRPESPMPDEIEDKKTAAKDFVNAVLGLG